MSSFHLQIVTPDGSFFDGEANSVVVRTTGGYVSIYPHHTDYIAALDIGRVVVTKDGEPRHAACGRRLSQRGEGRGTSRRHHVRICR